LPTYDELRAYFDNPEALTNLARPAAEVPIVRGFSLDVDPIWTCFYDAEDGLIPPHSRPPVHRQSKGESLRKDGRRAADTGSLRIAGAANDETFVRAGLRFESAVASELAALAVVEDIAPVRAFRRTTFSPRLSAWT
jgi:hypothetical protein